MSSWITTLISTDSKRIDYYSIHSSSFTKSSFGIHISTTIRSTEKGLLEREIIIYSLTSAVLVLFILLCTACYQRYRKIYSNLRKYQTAKRRRRNIPDNPLPELPQDAIEGIYEVIDESNMLDDVEPLRDNNTPIFDSNSSYVQPESNDYLTPYQPNDEDVNTNSLNDNKSESSGSSEASIYESSSSNTEVHERRCSYLNPYQPIVPSADIHEYSFTHNIDYSGSLESERESSYLNPYQPMIQARDSHEYKYVHGCSDGSRSSLSDTCTKEIGVKFPHPYEDSKLEI
ncbi:unnamed protein product [Mytilus coruscus]|uniref:Uncharacterized protein n=1 Tax=Mytilus coruscus TaxID=42192 RepID=A0A6J8CSZ9_MYTCO|nr:unnamed protein product [Mytilus coruscus]